MRRAGSVGTATGLVLVALSMMPARAATYGLVMPAADYPMPYLSIVVDDPSTTSGSPAVDVGETDFTIELFVKAEPGANNHDACDGTPYWGDGAVLLDRTRGADEGRRAFGASLSRTRIAFGATGPGGAEKTVCGSRNVADGSWHHVALQRRASDGRLTIWVDGALDASGAGPVGDISYPDAAAPIGCGNCVHDHLLFVGGKATHGSASFIGSIDEMRISKVLRYHSTFERPARAFGVDSHTVALYHFDEGTGTVARDAAGASDASFGADAAARPRWAAGSPFAALPGTGSQPQSEPPSSPTSSRAGPRRPPAITPSQSPTATASASTTGRARTAAAPPAAKSALATAVPIAGGVAAAGFLLAVIVLGLRASSRR